MGLKEGQPIVEASWAFSPIKPTNDRPLKETRVSFGLSRSERWFKEELLAGKMVSATKRWEK